MDIGVAQQNKRQLDFRAYNAQSGAFEPIVLPLVGQDGAITNVTVVDDLGAVFVSGRLEDMHRFKVPQLRKIKDLGPYAYNSSRDGAKHPIHLNATERANLLEFLKIL